MKLTTDVCLCTRWPSGNSRMKLTTDVCLCIPGGSVVRNLPANTEGAGDVVSTPGLGRSLGVENGNPLQYSCLGSLMDRGASQATVHGVTKSQT